MEQEKAVPAVRPVEEKKAVCEDCHGTGRDICRYIFPPNCPVCHGEPEGPCPTCYGRGTV